MIHRLLGIASTWARAPQFPTIHFFSVNFRAAQSLTVTFDVVSLNIFLYSVTAAAVVQTRLHEPCSVYYFVSFYV